MDKYITINGLKLKELSIKWYDLSCAYSNFREIGEGTTRFVYENNVDNPSSIYKRCIWYEDTFCNQQEMRLYTENYNICPFLAKVKGISKDKDVIEFEKLNTKPIEEVAKEIGTEKVDTIFEIIDRKPELGEDLDFSWDEVDNFIIENGLSYDEVYFYRNWAVNNEGKLRLIDYSR